MMNKEIKKRLFRWEGWKEESWWILFFLFLLLAIYGYYDLQTRHNELLARDCVWKCIANEYIEEFRDNNPGKHLTCDNNTRKCLISGWDTPNFPDLDDDE